MHCYTSTQNTCTRSVQIRSRDVHKYAIVTSSATTQWHTGGARPRPHIIPHIIPISVKCTWTAPRHKPQRLAQSHSRLSPTALRPLHRPRNLRRPTAHYGQLMAGYKSPIFPFTFSFTVLNRGEPFWILEKTSFANPKKQ